MKSLSLLLALAAVIALGSCTTAYKTGQTPDDVYYSPAQPADEYVQVQKRENRYYSSDEYYEDRYLRMKVRNRYRWNDLDDWYYFGNRYNYSYFNYNYWNNPWNPYTYWNYTCNPYHPGVIIVNPKSLTYSGPRRFNLNSYNSNAITQNNYSNPKTASSFSRPRTFSTGSYNNNSNSSRSERTNGNTGSFLRNVFNGSNNNSSSSSSNNSSNSSSSSSSGSSSSSSGSGSSAPVRRF